jgi:membrane protein YdbS with pleckstrin-like domain
MGVFTIKNTSNVKKITLVWDIRILAASAVVLAAAFEFLYVLPPLGVGLGILSLLAIGIGGWYVPNYFSRYLIDERADRVCVSSGVFIRKQTTVFFSDTVTVTITSSPMMRLMGMRTVVLSLAGKRVSFYAIGREDAYRIAGEIEKKGAAGCE